MTRTGEITTRRSWRTLAIGAAAAIGIVLLGALGSWLKDVVTERRRIAEAQRQQATAAAAYLFAPQDEIKGADGKPLTRAQLLDLLLQQALKAPAAAAQTPAAGAEAPPPPTGKK